MLYTLYMLLSLEMREIKIDNINPINVMMDGSWKSVGALHDCVSAA